MSTLCPQSGRTEHRDEQNITYMYVPVLKSVHRFFDTFFSKDEV